MRHDSIQAKLASVNRELRSINNTLSCAEVGGNEGTYMDMLYETRAKLSIEKRHLEQALKRDDYDE